MTYNSPQVEAYMVLGQELFRRIYADAGPEELHHWLREQLHKLSAGDPEARLLWEQTFETYDTIIQERAAQSSLPEAERRVLTWPWPSWNAVLDPLDPGLLAVLSAADGGGKTMYAENLAEHWAYSGLNVVFIHFELNRSLMLDRRMARQANIPRRDLKTGLLTPEQEQAYHAANERLRQWPGSITYVHTPGWTMEKAMTEVQALTAAGICDVFIIDYLEKAMPSERQLKTYGSNPFAREADAVETVKRTAEAIERPALLLAQLNKSAKQANFEDLDRSGIRGAGEKTEKANIVILLHRDGSENPVINVKIDKNTMGRCGNFQQYMHGARFLITDIQRNGA